MKIEKLTRLGFLAAIILLTAGQISAQTNGNVKFENISIKDGLSQSSPNCIYQDSRGFIWVGTEDGLNKYDGYSFIVYRPDPKDSNSISNPRILSILEDKEGNLWIGTNGGGLNKFDRKTDKFTHYKNSEAEKGSLAGNVIKSLAEYLPGKLWIGTDKGISVLEMATGAFYGPADIDPSLLPLDGSSVNAMTADATGSLWIGTDDGLWKYENSSGDLKYFHSGENEGFSLPDDRIKALMSDSRNEVWIGTEKGLAKYSMYSLTRQNFSATSDDTPVRALLEDNSGDIWVGTFGAGLFIYNPDNEHWSNYMYNYGNPYTISSNEILSLQLDASGIIWVGSNGLDKYNPKKEKFVLYDYVPYTKENLIFRNIYHIYEDNLGILWIGSKSDGLHILDRENKTYSHLTSIPGSRNSLPSDKIRVITEYPENTLWIGTDDAGLCRIVLNTARKPVSFTTYRYDYTDASSISSNVIYDIFVDNNAKIWVGTNNGLNVLDMATGTFTSYLPDENNPNSFSNKTAYCIYQDSKGQIWIATDYGINRYDPSTDGFIRYVHDDSDSTSVINNEILSFYEDKQGMLWIGTYGNGIDRLDPSTGIFHHSTEIGVLSKAVVYGILDDNAGNLWLSTNNGIMKFTPSTGQVKTFNIEDGLQSNEFNGSSYFRNRYGEMFFGGQYGFNSFNPKQVIIDSITPNIVLTDLQVNNKSVSPGLHSPLDVQINEAREINLRHSENNFTLYFSALHFANPENNKYKYKLEGFDEDWIDAGNKRFVTYTNLPYKTYTFRVIATNSDGVWNEEGLSVKIRIKPPFWSTLWFRIIAILLTAGLVFYTYRKRIENNEKQKVMLRKKFETSSEELEKAKDQLEKQREEIVVQKQELKLRQKEQKDLLWFNEGIGRFSELINKNKSDLPALCNTIISNLIEYVDAQQGGIYISRGGDGDITLELIAHNAYEESRIRKTFKPGVGYVGTCFLEKRPIEVDNLSDNYALLRSGLGEQPLKYLLLFPLKAGDKCIGVMELCSFTKLKGYKVAFIEKLNESFSYTINNELYSIQMKAILEESGKQANELQIREEELRQQLEMNISAREQFERREKELISRIEKYEKSG